MKKEIEMGLDIRAYSNVNFVREFPEDDEDDCHGKEIRVSINQDFPERCKNLKGGIYSFEDSMGFRAGSYSGYNQWRNELAVFSGYEDDKDAWKKEFGPFWELIYFSDCEGCIDFEISKKLYKDFCDFDDKAKIYDRNEDSYFYQKYNSWKDAFELASNNGCVSFQ